MIGFFKQIVKKRNFRNKWRNINNHNKTVPVNIFDINKVEIGRGTYGSIELFSWGHPNEKLYIGNYCSIANGVKFVLGGNHFFSHLSNYPFSLYYEEKVEPAETKGPININDGVWIGMDALILSGVKIGKGAIIGARTVVVNDIPPFAIVVGNPGKVIKYRFNEEVRNRLIKLNYYEFINLNFYENYKDLLNKPLSEALISILEKTLTEYKY